MKRNSQVAKSISLFSTLNKNVKRNRFFVQTLRLINFGSYLIIIITIFLEFESTQYYLVTTVHKIDGVIKMNYSLRVNYALQAVNTSFSVERVELNHFEQVAHEEVMGGETLFYAWMASSSHFVSDLYLHILKVRQTFFFDFGDLFSLTDNFFYL